MTLETEVLIIGGGATGTGIARDLALRGIKSILAEQGDINSGASGGNHGLLHSGARYVCSDVESAVECHEENVIIKKIASCCVEETGGLFIAVEGDDEKYIADFPSMCERAGIPYEEISIEEAKELEPEISDKTIAAYKVDDASVDPFKLSLENISNACDLGSSVLCHHKTTKFNIKNNTIETVELTNTKTGEITIVAPRQIINAAGAWADSVSALAGVPVEMIYSKGTLLVTDSRVTTRVINRLRHAADADILVPGGTVSILGTTSVRVDSPDNLRPTVEEVNYIVDEGSIIVPSMEKTRFIRAYSGVRPLVSSKKNNDDRDVSRNYTLIDHSTEGVENFTTITGGKLTTYRLMAEKTVDLVCKKMGVQKACTTAIVPLKASDYGKWTEPGLTPRLWLTEHDPDDTLLCECEMVSKKIIDKIIVSIKKQGKMPGLLEVGLRSRIGKGPCQGAFCGPRIAAYMYDAGYISSNQGVREFKEFFDERWKGQHSVSWDANLARAELHEALQCGLFGMEFE
jgi:glycerol-3-phosphate dehydrogenase